MKHTIVTFNSTLSFCPETLQTSSNNPIPLFDLPLFAWKKITNIFLPNAGEIHGDFHPHGSKKSPEKQAQTQVGATAGGTFRPRIFSKRQRSVESCCHKYLAQWQHPQRILTPFLF